MWLANAAQAASLVRFFESIDCGDITMSHLCRPRGARHHSNASGISHCTAAAH
jgi:hypothetical protein